MSFDPTGLTVYVDGDYVDGAEARVPLWDHGLLYGDGFRGDAPLLGSLFPPHDHLARPSARRALSSSRSLATRCST